MPSSYPQPYYASTFHTSDKSLFLQNCNSSYVQSCTNSKMLQRVGRVPRSVEAAAGDVDLTLQYTS